VNKIILVFLKKERIWKFFKFKIILSIDNFKKLYYIKNVMILNLKWRLK